MRRSDAYDYADDKDEQDEGGANPQRRKHPQPGPRDDITQFENDKSDKQKIADGDIDF